MRYLYNKKIKTEVSPFFTGFIFFPFFLKIDTKSLKLTMLQFSKKKKKRGWKKRSTSVIPKRWSVGELCGYLVFPHHAPLI